MATPYVGEIRMFAGNFAPAGWFLCNGQLVPIAEYATLFSLIGTTYGGDGQSTFGLPDLQGRFPVHQGGSYVFGRSGGVETVTLTLNQIPAHNHPAACSPGGGFTGSPQGMFWSTDPAGNTAAYNDSDGSTMMAAGAIGPIGGGGPHDNVSPFVVINFIISNEGVYPSQF